MRFLSAILAVVLVAFALPALAAAPSKGQARHASAAASYSVRAAVARHAYAPRPQLRASRFALRRGGAYRQVTYHPGRIGYGQARHGGRQSARACARHGRHAARCGGERRWAWAAALPPAAGVQTASCPEGTFATPARGHTSIMRCLPI